MYFVKAYYVNAWTKEGLGVLATSVITWQDLFGVRGGRSGFWAWSRKTSILSVMFKSFTRRLHSC